MADIHDLHKQLVDEAKVLANKQKELERKVKSARDLKAANAERRENIAKLEKELSELLDD